MVCTDGYLRIKTLAAIDRVKKQNRKKDRPQQTGVNFFHFEFEGRVGQPHADAADLRDVLQAENRFENVGQRQSKAAEDRRRHGREREYTETSGLRVRFMLAPTWSKIGLTF